MGGLGWCAFDRAQLPRTMGFNQSEFNWYIFEGIGHAASGARRIAGLLSIHRTGPRLSELELRPELITLGDLPAPLRNLGPSWLPILSPVRTKFDDRPLFMAVVYDLDHPELPPRHLEVEIEHAGFDAQTFSASTESGDLQLHQFVAADVRGLPATLQRFFRGDVVATAIKVQCEAFEIELFVRARKGPVGYGPDGGPRLRHGPVTTSYFQRPRLDVVGRIDLLDGSRRETISAFVGDASQDRQWMTVSVPRLKWIWPHFRLGDGRELMGYVIRDSSAGRWARADEGDEIGRGGWLVERDGTVRPLPGFDVRALPEGDLRTERGLVPSSFAVDVPELGLALKLDHCVKAPFLRMKAFGAAIDAGIYEGPARMTNADLAGTCWVEVMNAASARLKGRPTAE